MRNLSAFQPSGLKQIQLADTTLFADASLDAYYKLEDPNDSKNTNHLTGTDVTYTTGKFNNGASFSVSTAIMRLANSFQYTGNFSISGWVKPTDATAAAVQVVVTNELTGTAIGPYQISIQTSGKLRFSVFATGSGAETFVESVAALSDNVMVFFTCVRDGTNIILYLNGISNNSTAWSTAQITNASNYFQLGATQNSGGTNFRQLNGLIDDVGVFSRALTASEVSQLYYSGSTKAYYPLNGNSRDYSGNSNTGTDTAITYPQGRFGQGARFNGSTSKIQLPTSLYDFNSDTSFTITGWLKTSITTSQYIACRQNDSTYSAQFNVYMGNDSSGALQFEISPINNASNRLTVYATGNIANNQWRQFSIVYDGSRTASNVKFYVDGLLKPTNVVTNTLSTNAGTATPGFIGNRGSAGSFFTGNIDEVIIESRAWTAKEVETYYRKSTLNYSSKSLGQIVFTYVSELLKGTYTLTGRNLSTFQNYVRQLLKGAYTLTGKQITTTRGYIVQLLKGAYTLVGKALKVPNTWIESTKNSSTFTSETKHTSAWTDQTRN